MHLDLCGLEGNRIEWIIVDKRNRDVWPSMCIYLAHKLLESGKVFLTLKKKKEKKSFLRLWSSFSPFKIRESIQDGTKIKDCVLVLLFYIISYSYFVLFKVMLEIFFLSRIKLILFLFCFKWKNRIKYFRLIS